MKIALCIGSLVSGFALAQAAAYLGGFMASTFIPSALFNFFGVGHRKLALAMIEVIALALPYFLFSLAWCWITLRIAITALKGAAWCCLIGVVVGVASTELQSALALRTVEALSIQPSLWTYLWRIFPSGLALLNLLTFPAGLIIAVLLLRRTKMAR